MVLRTSEADILVAAPSGQVVALVEVKNRQRLSREVAIAIHRNLPAHDIVTDVPYFLLLSQDAGYLWRTQEAERSDSPPTLEFPMTDVVTRYWPHLALDARLRGSELELLVFQWLLDLSRTVSAPTTEPEQSLARTSFLEALHGTTITARTPTWSPM